MAKKIKYEKVREIVKADENGNRVVTKLTGDTGGYTRETTPALAAVGNEDRVNNKQTVKANTIKSLKSNKVETFDNDMRTVDTVNQYKQTKKELKEAKKNLDEKTKARQKKEKQIYEKAGQEFTPNFTNSQKEKISYLSKNKERTALPEQKITREEVDRQASKELEAEEKAYNDYKIANYLNNVAKVNNEETNLWDKTGGNVVRAVKDLVSPLTTSGENVITDEKGNKTFLPSYNQLKQEKVQKDYGNNLVGNVAKIGGDILYGGTKQLAAQGLNVVAPGAGSALYWTDMGTDVYENTKNKGYSKEQSTAKAITDTAVQFALSKFLGGTTSRLTGGSFFGKESAGALEDFLQKQMGKVLSNPIALQFASKGSAEAIEEGLEDWVTLLTDRATLNKKITKKDVEDTFYQSLYSSAIGFGTAGLVNAANVNTKSLVNSTMDKFQNTNQTKNVPINQNVENNKNIVKNEETNPNIAEKSQKVEEFTPKEQNTQQAIQPIQQNIVQPKQQTLEDDILQNLDNTETQKKINKFIEDGGKVLDKVPEGWMKTENATTAPNGYSWYNNGKSRFGGEYENALVKDTPTQQENLAEEKEKETVLKFSPETSRIESPSENVIKIKNNNLNSSSTNETKTEDTGVSIGDKTVKTQIPIDSKPNKLGQYIPKDGFSKEKFNKGKIGDSQFYKNVTERADFIQDEVRKKVQNDDYIKHYGKVTNEESMQEAFNDLNTRGTEAIADFFNNEKELTSKDTAMGWLLINQSQENGDYDFSNQVLRKMRNSATNTAQTLQMYNYYARLTPEGMYKWCGDQLLRAEEIFEKNKTKKWIENNKDRWQLTGEEVEFIKNQMEKVQKLNKMDDNDTTTIDVKGKEKKVTVDRAKQVEIARIQSMIENKIPPEKGQALNAWMRISMLGNLKTIGTRNPLGNAALRPINDVGDFIGSIADYAISKKTGVRTKGNFNPKAQIKGLVKGGAETLQDDRLGINTRNAKGNRFEIGKGKSFNERHTGVAKVLNPLSKLGNKADSKVSFLLDLGDRPFYEASYSQSLENQMKLNGIKDIKDVPDWMKKNAEQEALERTYQDDNNYTSAVIGIRKAMNKLNVKGYGLGDVLIPFAKTPANLTKAIVDYSPAGYVNALTKGKELKNSIENGQFTPEMQHKFVNQLGKATAGTILYAIGSALASSGVITGGSDEDKDLADFMKNTLGIQPYSIKIGDKTFTYDWAQPVASSLAIPADIQKVLKDSKKDEVDLEYIIHTAFSSGSKILLEQSFLEGIQDVLGGYGDPIDNLLSEIEGLPARAIPTLFQQITTYLDGTKKMSYGNKGLENAKAQVLAKTPFGKDLPMYRNSMGKPVEMYGGKNNFFNVFINPANYSEGNVTESAKEIYAIYQATNNKRILPRLVDNDLKNKDGTKLTNQQKSNFLKISGDIIDKNVKKLKTNDDYQSMSNEDKAETIKHIVDYAYNKARKDVTGHELSSADKKTEKAINSGYALYDYYATNEKINSQKQERTTSDRNRYQELADVGIDGKTYDEFKAFISGVKSDKDANGKTIRNSKKQKIINYIENLPLSAQQKQNLWEDYNNNLVIFQVYR